MPAIVQIKDLGKQYRMQSGESYLSLRDEIYKTFGRVFSRKKNQNSFWALKNLDLEIRQGERIGIIGRNGAGKSTLLKILSRITPPSTGKAFIHGKVASLLEVGTGFHPELTGKENIYFNGSILGLKKSETDQKLDAIIDFSGVEKFIDMPLKHYSSGMQLRLAFSVAAHLNTDILLIDEVLAVGDMEFQRKCIGKMEEISAGTGKTILFVSHNMHYISAFCNRAVLVNAGEKVLEGDSAIVVNEYLSLLKNKNIEANTAANDIVRLLRIETISKSEKQSTDFTVSEEIGIRMHYEVLQGGHILWLGHNIHNMQGVNVFDTHSVNDELYSKPHSTGLFLATVWIPAHFLNTGAYFISTAIFNHLQHAIHVYEKEAVIFNVGEDFSSPLTARGMSPGDFPGVVRPLLNWNIKNQNHG